MTDTTRSKYQEAGVDIDKGNAFVKKIKNVIADTHKRGVLNEIGGFSSLFSIDKDKYDMKLVVQQILDSLDRDTVLKDAKREIKARLKAS